MENRLDELKKEFPYISEEELRYWIIMGDMCARIDMESKSISHLRFKTNKKKRYCNDKERLA